MEERRVLALRHAIALGLLHGPAELLPISSSAHTTLVPWLAGWPYSRLEPELRKSFEVALHAGTVAALLMCPPTARTKVRPSFLLPAIIPAALAGFALGGPIERRLGTPATIAMGLLCGSAAMIAGELRARAPQAVLGREHAPQTDTSGPGGVVDSHPASEADARDGLALGLAQVLALMPGVSRNGATLAAARTRGFSRADCDRLSWTVGLPVIVGAALLKGAYSVREDTPRALRLPLVAGAASAFLSTLASTKVLTPSRRTRLPLVCAAYRIGLASLVIRRMRDNTDSTSPFPKK